MALPVVPPTPDAVPLQAEGDYQVPPPPPEQVYAQATSNGDLNTLGQQAKDNFGTPVGEAAAHAYSVIAPAAQKLDALAKPAAEAKTPQERNIAIADAYKSVKDYPQWGTALISYLMGDKKTALNMITGGQPVTTVKYGTSGKQYQYTVDQLGNNIGITDRNGNMVSPQEYEADGGGINQIENTLDYKNRNAINKENVDSLAKGLNGFKAYNAQAQAQVEPIKLATDLFSSIPKDLLKSKSVAMLQGLVTGGKSSEVGTNSSASGMNQQNTGVTGHEGEGSTTGMGGHLGGASPAGGVSPPGMNLPVGLNGQAGTSKDASKGTSASELNMATSASGKNAASGQTSTTNKEAFAKQMSLENIGSPEQQKLLQIWDIADGIQRGNQRLDASGERMPSFITPPSANSVAEGLPAVQIRLQKQMLNTELLNGFNKFYQDNIATHTERGSPPSMEQMEQAYSSTTGPGSYKAIQQKYIKIVSDILHSVPKDEAGIDLKSAIMGKPKTGVKPPETKAANQPDFSADRAAARAKYRQ